MGFAVEFLSGSQYQKMPGCALGRIVLGSDIDYFFSSLDFWTTDDYRHHWQEAISLIVSGYEKAALITDMGDPSQSNFITWWPMWLRGSQVHFKEQLLFMDELPTPFDTNNPYAHVGEYTDPISDDGERLSEWRLPVSDLVEFLNSSILR